MIIGPCTVVTGGPAPAVLDDAAVRVVGAHIAQVGPAGSIAAAHPDDTLWPARGHVLLPGLIDAHAHLARHLARGLALRSRDAWDRYDAALSPDDVHWAVVAALVEGLRHGVTTVCDFHRSPGCLDRALPEIVAAATKVGVRVATCYGACESDPPAAREAAFDESAAFARDLARRRSGRLRGMVGVRAGTLAGLDRLVHRSLEAAGTSQAVHVDLVLDATPAERWPDALWPPGALPAMWAHAERAPRGLLGAVQARGDALSATGIAAAAALGLETDLAWGSDAGLHAPPAPDASHAAGADRMQVEAHYARVWVHGARWAAEPFGRGIGTIAPGAPADLMLVDYRPATEFSSATVFDHLWSGLLRAPVAGVMVCGEVLVDNGQVVSVDEREVAARARECAARVWTRLDVDAHRPMTRPMGTQR
ncbi:MAG: amidohydrolase family protein [Candidatus Eisenbacteria bacterium]|nr:amidohydrolase family protein [Candidatus Eisenbacteria bacterium]